MVATERTPLGLLTALEQASLGNRLDAPEPQAGGFWRGLAFHIEELNIAVPFTDKFEILLAHEVFRLPLTRPWVVGMTNIRGEIYTLVDFSAFINRRPIRLSPQCHFLLLPDPGLKSALVLDGDIRLHTFPDNLQNEEKQAFDAALAPYLKRVIDNGGKRWGVMDAAALCSAPAFQQIGA